VLPRIRPVHRLDRETSGLMVFARTVEAERGLGQQFRKHAIHRRYLAIVQGRLEKPLTIDTRLVRDRGDGRRGSTTLPNVGKRAVTHVAPLEALDDYTLIECRLETGRTHQIRIHLAEAGHMLCGEKVYHQPLFQPGKPDTSGAPRVMLHAAELGFEHPVTGEQLHFQMDPPEDFRRFLAKLRQS
jgi:23S rRNA pseudouridine1911/1915/1917 synthase